jgi:uncharacterized protein (DUF1501 family)
VTVTHPTDAPGPRLSAAVPALHPDCPDLARLGPNLPEATLRARAARVQADRAARDDAWRGGFTRRRFLAGAGAVGVASLGTQLVTTRASFGADSGTGTLVVVFLRGGMDGLSVVVPADDQHLVAARPDISIPGRELLPLDRGFGLHPALAPLHQLWGQGRFTAVPAVSTPDLSRSHFQAQDTLERGGAATGVPEGWLDRVLDRMGPGTSFRSVSRGATVPRSMAGDQPSLSLRSVEAFKLAGWEGVHDRTKQALAALYTGLEHPLSPAVASTLTALDTSEGLNAAEYQPGADYPDGDFAEGLTEIARLVKADVGLRVAAIDVGGWDTHTNIGRIDQGDMKNLLTPLGEALAAFAADLGTRIDDVTVVAITEFGRRIEQNASNGADHGHGAVVLVMGGKLNGRTIHGNWQGLAPEVRDQGDVPGSNDYRNVLAEVVSARLGLSVGDLGSVFPDHQVQPLGIMRT